MSLCCKCNIIIFEHFFTCAGECSKIIHYGCVGIKKPVFDAISIIPNLTWRCDDCIEFNSIRKTQNESILKTMQTITDTLKTLSDSSTNIKKIDKNSMPQNSPVVANKANKNKIENTSRMTRSKQNHDPPTIAESTSTNAVDESSVLKIVDNNSKKSSNNTISSNIIIGTNVNNSLRVVEPLKWIFISRLHKDIVIDDLKKYLLDKFKIDEVKIMRIKPRIDHDDVNYVSFKIGVLLNNFNILLEPSSWPAGVLIKEFINYQRRSERFLMPRSALINQD